jgi:tetratricopeptide (TPR) repeat protein
MRRLSAVLILLAAAAIPAAAQDSITTARDLYAGAAYEDALQVLNRLRAAGVASSDARVLEQYRAFCLLALGRAADAEQAIEAVVDAEPLYKPSGSEVSPRLRNVFSDVRKRKLPTIVQQKYASAKAAYDRKDWVQAEAGFKQVLEVLGDPDLAATANQSPLADLKTLAAGFHDLSATAAAPPPPPPPPPIETAPSPAPEIPLPPRIYTLGDPGVVPPVPIRQALPTFPANSNLFPTSGAIEVVIDTNGAVESALMRVPLQAVYDRQAIAAARNWQYKPATLNGVPVKYRKIVQISVQR